MRRAKFFFLLILLIGSFLFLSNADSKILISKVRVTGANTSTDEFIELYNYSSSSITLGGWSLKKRTSGGTDYTLVSDFSTSTMNPFGYFLIAHRDHCDSAAPDIYYTNNSYSLANNNSLILLDPFGSAVDEVGWGVVSTTGGSPAANPAAGNSLARLPNNESGNYIDTDDSLFDFKESSALAFNSQSPSRPYWEPFTFPTSTATSTETSTTTETNTGIGSGFDEELWSFLKINEVMPNPESGPEWIEFYNATSTEIILDGGTVCDGRSGSCTIAELNGKISGNSWFTIFLSSAKLNNDGDSIILKNPTGTTTDEITYGAGMLPQKGQALARQVDGVDSDSTSDWAVTIEPTENAVNTIVAPPAPTPSYGGGGSSYISIPQTAITSTSSSTGKTTKSPKTSPITIIWNLTPPSLTRVNTTTFFDTHLSADPRGGLVSFLWNFGDGNIGEGAKTFHTYATSGIFTVTLSATSTQGTTGTTKFLIKVAPENSFSEIIFLSEISPAPLDGEDESIAISSRHTTSTDLSGWKIGVENDRWFTIPNGTFILPSSSLKFFRTALKLPLNNQEGTVYLAAPDEKIVDMVYYSGGRPGQNYTLASSSWKWLPKPESKTEKPKKMVAGIKIVNNLYFKQFSISDIYSLESGASVRVFGVVESVPGAPGSNYFYMKDDSGGIQIYSYKKDFPKLSIGDYINVKGEVGVYQGTNRIKIKLASDIQISSSTGIKAEEKALSEIDENDLGTLVSLEGQITELKTNYFYLDDGMAEAVVSLPVKAGIDRKQLIEGETVKVSGIVEKTTSGWRLAPRSGSDLVFLKSFETETKSSSTKNDYLIVTFTGMLLIGTAIFGKKYWEKLKRPS